jgi:phosphate starvation-inducible PhoH-like protein
MRQDRISIRGADAPGLLGPRDEHLGLLESAFRSKIVVRGDEVILSGGEDDLDAVRRVLTEMIFLLIDLVREGKGNVSRGAEADQAIVFFGKKGVVRPKTPGQEAYVQAVRKNDIVFAVGPAGTGKTYLAVSMALAALREKTVSRIVLTRPAIEAGESLGFLPGDLMEKVDPYLRPLTDALFEMLPSDQFQKHMERKIIEIVPLAYMRGRTLNDAFVILDEAQNTLPMQMKMFLTRLGFNSKAIVNGDVTQVDLPDKTESGLIQIQKILKDIEGIAFVRFDQQDVVRHRLVKEIIRAYEDYDGKQTDTETS